jgi:hypothetical protein
MTRLLFKRLKNSKKARITDLKIKKFRMVKKGQEGGSFESGQE